MRKIKTVLAGISGYGKLYTNALLDDNERFEIAGFVDTNPSLSERYQEITDRGIKLYRSLSEFFASDNAELAVISTPIHYHTRMITECLRNGANVLCEKPLSGDVRDIEKIEAAAEKAGRFVDIGYQWSHSETMRALKTDILSGIYGRPLRLVTVILEPRKHDYFTRTTCWAGRIADNDGTLINDSVVNNACAHYLMNMLFVLGKEMNTALYPSKVEVKLSRANEIETFDTAEIRCGFDNGAEVLFLTSHAPDVRVPVEFEYVFEKGRITYSYGKDSTRTVRAFTDSGVKDYGDPFRCENHKLYHCAELIENGSREVFCPPVQAGAQTFIINECYLNRDRTEVIPEQLLYENNGATAVKGLTARLLEVRDAFLGNKTTMNGDKK